MRGGSGAARRAVVADRLVAGPAEEEPGARMPTVDVRLSEPEVRRTAELARELGVARAERAAAAVRDLPTQPEGDVRAAAERLLRKDDAPVDRRP
jgi:hypothetical protein